MEHQNRGLDASWALTAASWRAVCRRHMAAQSAIAAEWDWGTQPAWVSRKHDEHGQEAVKAAKLAREAAARA